MAAGHAPRACHTCLEVKPADAFDWGDGTRGSGKYRRRRTNCRECFKQIELAREEERQATLERVLARKASWDREDGVRVRRCSHCREVQVEAEEFYVDGHGRDGAPRYHSHCRACSTARITALGKRKTRDPVEGPKLRATRRKQRQRWRAKNPEKNRAADRRYRAKIAADAVLAAKHRDEQRMDYRLRSERKGRKVTTNVAAPHDSFPRLPARPLAAAIQQMVEREDRMLSMFDPCKRTTGSSMGGICERLGIQQRTYTGWRSGERLFAEFDQVDTVLTRAGWLWWEVFNEETCRRPLFVAAHRELRSNGPSQPASWQTVRRTFYGDAGVDLEALALVEQAFTGEGGEEDTKRCVKCEATWPVSSFAQSGKARDGLDSWCKGCHAAYYQEQREARQPVAA